MLQFSYICIDFFFGAKAAMTQREVQAQETVQDGKVFLNADGLKALRKQHGLSQDALAQLCLEHRLCVSIASIERAETGKAVAVPHRQPPGQGVRQRPAGTDQPARSRSDPRCLRGCRATQRAGPGHATVGRIDMQLVAVPTILISLRIAQNA